MTASGKQTFEEFEKAHDVNYRYFLTDRTTLKTIIRANPGVLLMRGNVIKGKWSDRNIPSYEEIKAMMEESPEPSSAER
jgi:hypothetical protein